jgi:hypothetical protein
VRRNLFSDLSTALRSIATIELPSAGGMVSNFNKTERGRWLHLFQPTKIFHIRGDVSGGTDGTPWRGLSGTCITTLSLHADEVSGHMRMGFQVHTSMSGYVQVSVYITCELWTCTQQGMTFETKRDLPTLSRGKPLWHCL